MLLLRLVIRLLGIKTGWMRGMEKQGESIKPKRKLVSPISISSPFRPLSSLFISDRNEFQPRLDNHLLFQQNRITCPKCNPQAQSLGTILEASSAKYIKTSLQYISKNRKRGGNQNIILLFQIIRCPSHNIINDNRCRLIQG